VSRLTSRRSKEVVNLTRRLDRVSRHERGHTTAITAAAREVQWRNYQQDENAG
jgi:hypothetical protein